MNYNSTDFSDVVLAETANQGVDVVFDNVGEAVMEASMKCTKYNGRYLMMGFASNKLVADEKFVVPRRDCIGQLQALRCAHGLPASGSGGVLEDGHGLELRSRRAR